MVVLAKSLVRESIETDIRGNTITLAAIETELFRKTGVELKTASRKSADRCKE